MYSTHSVRKYLTEFKIVIFIKDYPSSISDLYTLLLGLSCSVEDVDVLCSFWQALFLDTAASGNNLSAVRGISISNFTSNINPCAIQTPTQRIFSVFTKKAIRALFQQGIYLESYTPRHWKRQDFGATSAPAGACVNFLNAPRSTRHWKLFDEGQERTRTAEV